MAIAAISGLGGLDRGAQRIGEGDEAALQLPRLAKFEQFAFGHFDLAVGRGIEIVRMRIVHHILTHRDQLGGARADRG